MGTLRGWLILICAPMLFASAAGVWGVWVPLQPAQLTETTGPYLTPLRGVVSLWGQLRGSIHYGAMEPTTRARWNRTTDAPTAAGLPTTGPAFIPASSVTAHPLILAILLYPALYCAGPLLDYRQIGSGEAIRTPDLRVMSPTSYHCSTPHGSFVAQQNKVRNTSTALSEFQYHTTAGRTKLL